jgi:hypothetical protein
MNDFNYIDEVEREIEKKLNSKSISLWTDNDYKKLSQLILEETTVSISPQTLKRLFGKVKYKEIYSPQIATKDALALFLGYKDWQDFVNSRYRHKPNRSNFNLIQKLKVTRKMAFLFGALTLTALMVFLFLKFSESNNDPIVFFTKDLSGTIPYTVSFKYDISKIKSHDVYIDFDQKETEDSLKLEKLNKDRTVINHCFDSPGFYNVRLIADGKVLASAKIHVLADGWISYYFNDDNYAARKFVFEFENKIKDQKQDSLLYISPNDITDQGFKSNAVYYLEHLLYKDFEISADSSLLEVKYKNSPTDGGISCYDVEFRIIGENGIVSVMLVQSGCYRWSEVTVGEVHLNGKFNDLTKLSTDLTSWNTIRMINKNYKSVIVNGQDTIFSSAYQTPIGRIKGIRLVTKGSGAFDYVRLLDSEGKLKFVDNFSN